MNVRDEARKGPQRLQEEIERVRADVGDTLEALQRRMSSGEILDEMWRTLKIGGADTAEAVERAAREHPTAFVVGGAALAALLAAYSLRDDTDQFEPALVAPPAGEARGGPGKMLMMGIGAIAAGAVLGAAIPLIRGEREMFSRR